MDIMKTTLIAFTILAALSSAALLWLIRHPKTPRALDFVVGIQLIVFAAFFLGLLGNLRGLISDDNELKAGYDVALLVIPFFTAGLGTNILSHVVLSDRDYEGTISTPAIGKKLVHWLLILTGILFPPILIGYAVYLKRAA
ncbi:hypothetical protein DT594_16220 [Halopseudomonas laoshanensis]|uniref:Uncharacterized protein n=1 Tax=Halopseudomonas laoshanensis TaxID=2268758 RepID=A0A7V7GQP1_9GAMM|nr:hypothetical protein [Halopseudomonas laoshanensis]KAA0692494.1 hypothetical protein DT594_16220 [Halopseudomonas laoshanensis]